MIKNRGIFTGCFNVDNTFLRVALAAGGLPYIASGPRLFTRALHFCRVCMHRASSSGTFSPLRALRRRVQVIFQSARIFVQGASRSEIDGNDARVGNNFTPSTAIAISETALLRLSNAWAIDPAAVVIAEPAALQRGTARALVLTAFA